MFAFNGEAFKQVFYINLNLKLWFACQAQHNTWNWELVTTLKKKLNKSMWQQFTLRC